MAFSESRQAPSRSRSFLVVVLISLLALGFAFLAATLFATWEAASVDMRMRWRYSLTPKADRESFIHPDIRLLAIDAHTLAKLGGRYGSGSWLTRRPFVDQLDFFETYLQPTVIAYDIVIEDARGEWARASDITESPDHLREISQTLERIAETSGEHMDIRVLDRLNRFSMEQGNAILVNQLASIQEDKRFDVLLAYYFMGGWVDPQRGMSGWTDQDVFGSDDEGDDRAGDTIFYLKEMAIPEQDVHFTDAAAALAYDYCPNGRLPSPELRDYSWLGYVNCPRDEDTIVRRVPLILGFEYSNSKTGERKQVFVPSFSLAACLLHLGLDLPLKPGQVEVFLGREIVIHAPEQGEYRVPVDEQGRLYLNFRTKLQDFPKTSLINVVLPSYGVSREFRQERAEEYRDQFEDHLVFVGVTAAAVDVGAYPLSSDKPTPLVHVHLTAASNILGQNFIAPLGASGQIVLWILLVVAFTLLCQLERTVRLAPASILLAMLYMVTSYAAIHFDWTILPLVGPGVYFGLCAFGTVSYRFFTEARAKRRIRGMFSTMVSDKVLTFLEESPDSFSLTGHSVEATILFSDIESFTSIGERLPPDKLTELLNTYFTPATNSILDAGGYLDKYVGDEIMAVWGAPYPDSDHALKACLSALDQQRLIREMNPSIRTRYGAALRVRMGINSGTVAAGNMGSEKKLQYTVMGDAVNLASRLEPVNKDFGTTIIIGNATYQLTKEHICARMLARIVVVGKKEVLPVYEVMGERGKIDEKRLEMASSYGVALDCLHERDWGGCLAELDRLAALGHDPAADLLRTRALACRETPPPPAWQGEYVRGVKG